MRPRVALWSLRTADCGCVPVPSGAVGRWATQTPLTHRRRGVGGGIHIPQYGHPGYERPMPRSWTCEHPKSVTATGGATLAVVVAGVVATAVGAVAIPARSYGPLVVVAAAAGLMGLVVSVPALWHMARAGRLGPARPAGGVGEQDAQPATEAEPSP